MLTRTLLPLLALAPFAAAPAQWKPLQSGTRASLRGLSVVDSRTVWASGTRGTVIRTTDGGTTWQVDSVPGAERHDLRAVHAHSDKVAHVASTAGRIWRTADGGRTWSLRYQATDTTVFLDALAFRDDRHGLALGDPMGGRFLLLTTEDGGDTWHESAPANRPATADGEAAFAASGSSLLVDGDHLWIGSGGAAARLHHSADRGRTWTSIPTGFVQGDQSKGIFSLARGASHVLAVGGDFRTDSATRGNVGLYDPVKAAWESVSASAPPRGYRSGVAVHRRIAVAVGPGGSDISTDGGLSWKAFDATGFHAVRASHDGTFFASGSDGRVAVYHPPASR